MPADSWLRAECPHCGKRLWLPDVDVGQRGQCPRCKNEFQVAPLDSNASKSTASAASSAPSSTPPPEGAPRRTPPPPVTRTRTRDSRKPPAEPGRATAPQPNLAATDRPVSAASTDEPTPGQSGRGAGEGRGRGPDHQGADTARSRRNVRWVVPGAVAVLLLGLAGISLWPKGGARPVADSDPHATEATADASGSSTSVPLPPQEELASAPLWPATDNPDKKPSTAAAAPSPSIADAPPLPTGQMTSPANVGMETSPASPKLPEKSGQQPAMSLDELERLAEKAIADRDVQAMARLRELLKEHPATLPRAVRLGERLSGQGTAIRDPRDVVGRRLAIIGLSRLDSGDEFGAYLLARSARSEWLDSSPWWKSDAVKTLLAEGPSKFSLEDHGSYDALRGGKLTVPDGMLEQALAQNVVNQMPRGVVRVFCENEAVETRLIVEGAGGCVVVRGHGYSGSGETQSGDLVVVGSTPQNGSPRLRISGLRHQPAEIEPRFSKGGAYWGAVVLRELSATQIGELQIRLEPEAGLTAADLFEPLQLRIGPNPYSMITVSDWAVPAESWVGNVLQVAPAKYSFQVQCTQAATPISQVIEIDAGNRREVHLPLFRRRQVTFEWKYRPQPDAEIVEGTGTVTTGASVMMKGWEGYARNVFLKVDDWNREGCRLSVSNAFARTVPDGTWNSPTWIGRTGTTWLNDAPIQVGTTVLMANAIRGSEGFTALVRVRDIKVIDSDPQ